MTTPIPRAELNDIMTKYNDHWPADGACNTEDVRGYATYMVRAAEDPQWLYLSAADRAANLAQAAEMVALVDRIEAAA
jgi:hypothetical protein